MAVLVGPSPGFSQQYPMVDADFLPLLGLMASWPTFSGVFVYSFTECASFLDLSAAEYGTSVAMLPMAGALPYIFSSFELLSTDGIKTGS